MEQKMDVREYLREEFLEEAEMGFVSSDELERRLSLFDGTSVEDRTTVAKAQVPNATSPLSVPESDTSVVGEDRTIDSATGPLDIYVVKPSGEGPFPGVVLIHENQGLVPHIRDVARRLAKSGYVVLAPDLLTPAGGVNSFSDSAERVAALGTLDRGEMVTQLLAAFQELSTLPNVDASHLGALGFCFGGGMTWMLATREPRLKAAVPFYGPIPPLESVPEIQAAVLAIYGALDERINAGIPQIEPAMAAAGKSFEKEVYEGAGHAFHNDTNPDRYHADSAASAWSRATAFLDTHLK
jgi:carboxymethylenebutenolidase